MNDRNLELENLYKKECEDFLYTVSHDMGAPVRHIREFTKLLEKELGDDMSESARQYSGFIQGAAHRLSDMQSALLDLSRIKTTHNPDYQNLDVADIVNHCLSRMKANVEQVEFDNLGVVVGDPKQVEDLFSFLIDNAFKYCDPSRSSEVKISRVEDLNDKMTVFKISDNGIGIDERHFDNVFNVFRRLHGSGEYGGGAGVGLTMAQKIVQQHGGRIWLESELGQGTSVFFSLPTARA